MSAHWRLALRCGAWVSAGAALVGAVIWFFCGEAYAGAFLYGVGVGVASFVSMALTVSLLTGRSVVGVLTGVASFVARYGFVAVALGVPAYLELWPTFVMVSGFAGVYLAENVVLLPWVLMAKRNAGRPVRERVERKVEA